MLRRLIFSMVFSSLPLTAIANNIVDDQILPGFKSLAQDAGSLSETAQNECDISSVKLRASLDTALASWTRVSHLRFGPTEIDNRGFSIAFWPDTRGKTAKVLQSLIAGEDEAVRDPDRFADVSIAGRGLYALEYVLYDEAIISLGNEDYRCDLVQAIALDISRVASAISKDWRLRYADELKTPGAGGLYQSEAEVKQELFKALTTGLQINGDLRLGRPLGTFDKPRPKRAEAWRSENSLRQVEVSLGALRELAIALAFDDADLQGKLDKQFATALDAAEKLDDPSFAGVTDPIKRLRIEALQQEVNDLRALVSQDLGAKLGVTAGFNSLDGD